MLTTSCLAPSVCTGYERWAILHVFLSELNWEKHRESKIVCTCIIYSLDLEQRAICRTCPFMIHAVFEGETSLDVWGWAALGARFQRAPCWWRFGSEKVFFLVSRLQFKLYLFQFWLLSVKLLLNDELGVLQIHSVNRNPHVKCSQGHFVSFH